VTALLDRIGVQALGTTCSIGVTARPLQLAPARAALAAGRAELEACERALSRFDPASDLSRANRRAGSWVEVDLRLVEALDAALRLREVTDGRCDPTVLPDLLAAGYDDSYERLRVRAPRRPSAGAGARVDVDRARLRVRVAAGAAVDVGATGKGFVAARVLEAVRSAWPRVSGAIADLGGDVAVFGAPPDRGPWLLGVEEPGGAGTLGTIRLGAGGAATSGPARRRFGPDRGLHHLIDVATGRPARQGPLAVTVVSDDPVAADGHATALAVTPLAETADYLARRPHLGAVVVGPDGPDVHGRIDFVPARKEALV